MQNTPFKFATKEDYAANWAQHFKDYTDDSTVLDEAVFDSIAKANWYSINSVKEKPRNTVWLKVSLKTLNL